MNNNVTANTAEVTVKSLRQSGYKVMVNHQRRYWDNANKRWVFMTDYVRSLTNIPVSNRSNMGGMTEVFITNLNTKKNFQSVAECSSKDRYCKKMGLKIALGRILKDCNIKE